MCFTTRFPCAIQDVIQSKPVKWQTSLVFHLRHILDPRRIHLLFYLLATNMYAKEEKKILKKNGQGGERN